jgi:iron(III) transport system permease protein
LENAAYNLGASKVKTLISVILPVLKDAFVNSFIRVFSSTMTTLGAIVFLLMPANKVIIQVIFQAITGSNLGATAIMALMLSSFTLLCILAFYFIAYGKDAIKTIRRKTA